MALNGLFCADVPLRNYSLTHSRLVPNSMTLNDLERQNMGLYGFFLQFWAATQVYFIDKWRHGTIIMRSR